MHGAPQILKGHVNAFNDDCGAMALLSLQLSWPGPSWALYQDDVDIMPTWRRSDVGRYTALLHNRALTQQHSPVPSKGSCTEMNPQEAVETTVPMTGKH